MHSVWKNYWTAAVITAFLKGHWWMEEAERSSEVEQRASDKQANDGDIFRTSKTRRLPAPAKPHRIQSPPLFPFLSSSFPSSNMYWLAARCQALRTWNWAQLGLCLRRVCLLCKKTAMVSLLPNEIIEQICGKAHFRGWQSGSHPCLWQRNYWAMGKPAF